MGYVLLWIEGLAAVLLTIALLYAIPWRIENLLWWIFIFLITMLAFGVVSVLLTIFTGIIFFEIHLQPSWLFGYCLSWTLSYLIGMIIIRYHAKQMTDGNRACSLRNGGRG
jgi:hypothetical protein